MAKRGPRWGVHTRARSGLTFWKGLYRTQSNFTVRGRTEVEARQAAEKVMRKRRNSIEPFTLRKLD